MKRTPLLVMAFFATVSPALFAGSIDFGGSATNSTSYGNSADIVSTPGSAASLFQKDVGNLWFQAAINDQLLFSAQIGGAFEYTPGLSSPLLAYADADLFNLRGTFPTPDARTSLFRFAVGRIVIADFTSLVLAHRADGFSVDLEYPSVALKAAVGYTGLLVKGTPDIFLSRADVDDSINPGVAFSPPRLVQLLELSVPSLFGQKLTVSVILQEDMRDTVLDLAGLGKTDIVTAGSATLQPDMGGPVNTQYFGLGASGEIVPSLFYDLYSYLETGSVLAYTGASYQQSFFFSALAGGGIRWYLPSLLFSVLGGKLLYVSGDPSATTVVEDGTSGFSAFTPISRATLNLVFSPQVSNIVRAEASWSVKPLTPLGGAAADSLQVALQANAYLRPTPGAISLGVQPGNTDLYLGTETDLTATFRPFSDLGLTLAGGVFFPGSAFGAGAPLEYRVGADLTFSF